MAEKLLSHVAIGAHGNTIVLQERHSQGFTVVFFMQYEAIYVPKQTS